MAQMKSPPPPRKGGRPPRPARPEAPGARGGGGPSLLFGVHAVAAAWTNPERHCRVLFATQAGLDALAPALAQARSAGLDRPAPRLVDRLDLDRRLPAGAVHQGLALDAAPLPEASLDDVCREAALAPESCVVLLDQVTDPHNVGAILRSAAAFGARAVIVQDRHAPEVTGTLAKSASGAVEHVPLIRVANLAQGMDLLKRAGFWCVGLAEGGTRPLHALDLKGRTAIVLGAEGEGLRRLTQERCDEVAHLPTGGPIGSLNVSNAAAVALYEVARRR
jgi:23S rRNA (guanosine2251-2'-O)-methyltransferase